MLRARAAAVTALLLLLAVLLGACRPPPPPEAPQGTAAAWERLPPPDDLPAGRPLRVAFLVVDGVFNTELTAPYDVFQHTAYHPGAGAAMEVFTVSPDGGEVTTAEGLRLLAHHGFADAPEIDVLVVPSAEGSRDADLEDEAMIAWVRETGAKARYVLSLCWGAFVLAEADLLDGLAATTFPHDLDRFAERYPEVDLRRGPSFVHHGRALTSQGGVESFAAAMYLVDHLYGEEVARAMGGGLLIDWPPAPGELEAEIVPP